MVAKLPLTTTLTLMIIPRGMQFLVPVDRRTLPQVSCVYQIEANSGAIFDEVVALFESAVQPEPGSSLPREARIGLIFKKGDEVVRSFHFEDFWGLHDIKGLPVRTCCRRLPIFLIDFACSLIVRAPF
jgi:hypothetical protein